MLKILIPVDGSPAALDAARFAAGKLAAGSREAVELHLLNVQPPVATGDVTLFVSRDQIEHWQREEGDRALAQARAELDRLGAAYSHHVCVGHAAEAIIAYAREHGADLIVMGNHGKGALANLLMGSVATRVLQQAVTPVLLVK